MCRILYEFGSKWLQGSVEKYSLFESVLIPVVDVIKTFLEEI